MSSSNLVDVNEVFDFTPADASGTKRALLVGINYIGHESGVLSGCHNDVLNMVEYIKDVHGFEEENITILLDDDEHTSPTYANMVEAYKTLVDAAEPGDALFVHYSGHGCGIKDDESEESDGKDEALVPIDYLEAGVIRDDELYEILIKPLKDDVHMLCLMDCCHSGSILDLPYVYKAGAGFEEMGIDKKFKFGKLFQKLGAAAVDLLDDGDDDDE
jgi:metacaspase-1